ncbi:MAG: hypothetical protein HYU36_14280 [Planctomycetes bacterium]|nr:hypothetical protein [Planctomycetota bacterium]
MGLTIRYKLRTSTTSITKVRELVGQLRQRALDLSFKKVGEIVEVEGEACDYERRGRDDPLLSLLIDSNQYIERARCFYTVQARHVIAFSAWAGEGCEQSGFGLSLYPPSLQTGSSKRLRTGLKGWSWSSFCKTQYASDGRYGGVENFIRCHLLLVHLLDHAKSLGILAKVGDDSHYWEKRDVKALAQQVGLWNTMIAGWVGRLNDATGRSGESAISKFPDYEHLEAKGREEKKS